MRSPCEINFSRCRPPPARDCGSRILEAESSPILSSLKPFCSDAIEIEIKNKNFFTRVQNQCLQKFNLQVCESFFSLLSQREISIQKATGVERSKRFTRVFLYVFGYVIMSTGRAMRNIEMSSLLSSSSTPVGTTSRARTSSKKKRKNDVIQGNRQLNSTSTASTRPPRTTRASYRRIPIVPAVQVSGKQVSTQSAVTSFSSTSTSVPENISSFLDQMNASSANVSNNSSDTVTPPSVSRAPFSRRVPKSISQPFNGLALSAQQGQNHSVNSSFRNSSQVHPVTSLPYRSTLYSSNLPTSRTFPSRPQNETQGRTKKPSKTVHIKSLDDCRQAISVLSLQDRVAVDCEGVSLSRTGRLCLIQLAIEDLVYIVDLISEEPTDIDYARTLFEQGGLKKFLENPHIIKVVHDCRHDSDALFHQFGVKLGPVIDTQVAFRVVRRVRGMDEGLPVSLKTLLKKFAFVSADELDVKSSVKDSMKENDQFWLKRPLSEQALCYARFDVEHLLQVAQTLHKLVQSIDPEAWQMVLNQSQQYLALFRDDVNGPRRAQQRFEQLAQDARRRRLAFEQSKKIDHHRRTDPLRCFTFDHARIIHALTS